MITYCNVQQKWPKQYDHNNQLITLTMIILRGFKCTNSPIWFIFASVIRKAYLKLYFTSTTLLQSLRWVPAYLSITVKLRL